MTPAGRRETSQKEKQDWLTERTLRRVEGQQKVWTSTPPPSLKEVCVCTCVCAWMCVYVCVCVCALRKGAKGHTDHHIE